MANTLTSIRLSETQKTLMCQITAAPTEELAYEASENGTNIVAARDQLEKLGLLVWEEGSASITDAGTEVMKDEALLDQDSGELTELGNKYVYGESGDQQQAPEPEGDPMDLDMGMGDGRDTAPNPNSDGDPLADGGSVDQAAQNGDDLQMNSFDMIRAMNDVHILSEQIRRFKKS